MNSNDFSSIQNKNLSADSGLYGNGSAYRTPQNAQVSAFGSGAYYARENVPQASGYQGQPNQRVVYETNAANVTARNTDTRNAAYSNAGYSAQPSAQRADQRPASNSPASSYRTNYAVMSAGSNDNSARPSASPSPTRVGWPASASSAASMRARLSTPT